MKYLIVILLCLPIAELTSASPYVMTKHEFKMKDSDYSKTINHIRFGNSWKTEDGLSLYGEVGIAESINNGSSLGDGDVIKSYEFGFKKKLSNRFSVKGKWEGTEVYNSTHSHKIEIKTKWEF